MIILKFSDGASEIKDSEKFLILASLIRENVLTLNCGTSSGSYVKVKMLYSPEHTPGLWSLNDSMCVIVGDIINGESTAPQAPIHMFRCAPFYIPKTQFFMYARGH